MPGFDEKENSAFGHIARGAAHTLGSTFVGRLVNWVAVVVLMRELNPEDFGHVAMAAAILGVVVGARNLGLHLALIRHYGRVDQLAPTHFVLNMALGTAGTILAGLLAYFYVLPDPEMGQSVAASLSVFALFDLLRTAAQTAETQLRRDLEFTSLAHIHAISLVLAAAGGIILAHHGAGYWAYVFSHTIFGVGYVALYVVQIWRRRPPWPLRLQDFDPAGARELMAYGYWIWIGAALQSLLLNADRLIVGALISARALGFYERAHTLAQLPTGAVTNVITGIMNTVFARYQSDRERLSGAFHRALRLVARSAIPLSLVLAIEIPRLTLLLFDDSWSSIVGILRLLVIYSICRPLQETVHALLRGIGDARGMVGFALVQTLLLLVAAPLLARSHGLEGVAIGMNGVALVGIALAFGRVARFVDVPWARTLAPPLLAGVAGFGLRLGAEEVIAPLPDLPAVVAGVACFGLGYALVLFALERDSLMAEFRTLVAVLRKGEDGF